MLKKYLLAFISLFIIFGCKNTVSYEGVLMFKNDLPFEGYGIYSEIFLKTSIRDDDFPDGVRYFIVNPKGKYYQDFKNNIGRNVRVRGEEKIGITSVNYNIDIDYEQEENDKKWLNNYYSYDLNNAKIVKVLD